MFIGVQKKKNYNTIKKPSESVHCIPLEPEYLHKKNSTKAIMFSVKDGTL